jgi:WD40 repeat protein
VRTGKATATLKLKSDRWWADLSPDGRQVAEGSGEAIVKVREVETGKVMATLSGPGLGNSTTYGADGKSLAVWANGGAGILTARIQVFEIKSKKALFDVKVGNIACLAFRPDGKALAMAQLWGRTVTIGDVKAKEEVATLEGHDDHVFALAFSPDGRRLATASWDGTIKLWDVPGPGKAGR